VLRFAIAALLIAAAADAQHPETLSLLGEPLYPPSLEKSERKAAESAYAEAHAAFDKQPSDPAAIIAFARASYVLGHVGDAVEILTKGLEAKPDDPAMLAERGRGFILIRKFAVAQRDLRKVVSTMPASRCPLALAMYLQAEFAASRDMYRECAEPGIYAALAERRAAASPAKQAAKPADTPAPSPPIKFPGSPPSPKPKEAAAPIEARYADAIERLLAGDEDGARERLKTVVEKFRRNDWMEVAYIAAEADYARLYKPVRKKR